LYRRIRRLGFYVRIHGYEYLIADDKRILALLFLEPWTNRAELRVLVPDRGFVDEITSAILLLDPGISIEVIYPSSTSDRSHPR
jgi:hypothetical protein